MTDIYAIDPRAATLTALPRRAEAALSSRRAAEIGDGLDAHVLGARDHELGDALAAANNERFGAQIDQQNLDLAAIVGIDGAGAVQNRHAGFQREPRAGP